MEHTSGQVGLAPPATLTFILCIRVSLLPFLPEVGKTLGLPQLLPVAPLHLWAKAPQIPRLHGRQPKAKMPQADLLAGSEAAEAINSSGAPALGPVGPSVTVMGAKGGERERNWGGAKLQGPPQLWHGALPAATASSFPGGAGL